MRKLWKTLTIGLCTALCVSAFTACGNAKDEKTGNGTTGTTAGTTQAQTATEPESTTEEIPEAPEVKPTDGIFACAADASHKMILKLKEDGTFYANDMTMQTAYQGKYEVVDMEIEYVDAGADNTLNYVEENGQKVVGEDGRWIPDTKIEPAQNADTYGQKAKKAVRFFEMDGTTPFVVNDSETDGYSYTGVDSNVAAYTEDGRLHNVKIGSYTRTLEQDASSAFSASDEIRNLLYELMPSALPAWAEEYNSANETKLTVQDLTFKVYHNGYDDMASSMMMVSGTFTEADGTYTLSEGGTLKITQEEDTYSAVYTNGDVTIELVKWNDGSESAPALYSFEGEAFGGAVTLQCLLYEDGTCELYGKNAAGDSLIDSGTWESGAGLPGVTLEKGSAAVGAASATEVTLTYKGDIGAGEAEYVLNLVK